MQNIYETTLTKKKVLLKDLTSIKLCLEEFYSLRDMRVIYYLSKIINWNGFRKINVNLFERLLTSIYCDYKYM